MHGKKSAYNAYELKKYCNRNEIPFPLTSSSPSTTAAPGPPPATKANYPSLSEAKSAKSATKAHSKPPPATLSAPVSLPKKPTNHAMSLTTQRPLPPPPKQTAPSSSTSFPPDQPETPAPEESADVHMADPNSTDLSFEAMLQAQDVAMTPAQELYPDPMDTSTSPTHFASLNTPVRHSTSTHLRPTIHPPTRPTPDAPMVHAEPQTPSLFQRFAEVFRPLPFIGNLFKLVPDSGYQLNEASVMSKGLDIFRWLFPSSSSGTDTTQALTDDMPLASMISACVDVEASFADPMTLSRPQICPEPPDVAPLPLPSPSDSSFDQLVHFLHDHVSDHLRRMQQVGTFTEVFATFIVGPPDHSNAGSSLHSHLVGCATTDPDTHHLALYVPTGAGQPYTGPSEWAPVMVHIAASLLWPDLPFLVTSPDYILGAQATLSELRRCLGYPSAFSLFTTSHSLAGSDVLLHFPPPSTFSLIPVSTPPIPFADPLPPLMISAIPPRMMHFNLLQLLPFHKWRRSTPSLGRSPPMQWTPTYTTRYSAPLTMVTNPPRTQTFWLWYTNSRPSSSIAAIPRKVPSTLLLTPTMLSTARRQTLCRSSQRPINSGPPFTRVRESLCARSLTKGSLRDRSPSPGFTMLIRQLRRLLSSAALLMFSRRAPNNIALPYLTALSV